MSYFPFQLIAEGCAKSLDAVAEMSSWGSERFGKDGKRGKALTPFPGLGPVGWGATGEFVLTVAFLKEVDLAEFRDNLIGGWMQSGMIFLISWSHPDRRHWTLVVHLSF